MDYVYFLDDYKREDVYISNIRIQLVKGNDKKLEVLLFVIFMSK